MKTNISTRKGVARYVPTIRSLACLWLATILIIVACSSNDSDSGGGMLEEQRSSPSVQSSSSNIAGLSQYCYGYSYNGYSYSDCNLVGGKWILDEEDCFYGGGTIVNTDYCNNNGVEIDNTPRDGSSSSAELYQSSSSVYSSSSSSSATQSSSSKDPTLESCLLSEGNCYEYAIGLCSILGGTPVESCPKSSSSSILCAGFIEGTQREHYGIDKPQFCDPRDGKKYVYVAIGTQTWMAENLNYGTSGSCYNNSTANCDKYGRLYNWYAAISTYNPICPTGWHIPSGADWDVLMKYVQESNGSTYTSGSNASIAGKHLKAKEGWTDCSASGGTYSCLDTYGFAALPGGHGYTGNNADFGNSNDRAGDFYNAGYYGLWWSDTGYYHSAAYLRRMDYDNDVALWGITGNTDFLSVRCLQD